MAYNSLRNTPLVRMLARTKKSMDSLNSRFSGIAQGPVRATIADVEDPQERGRVRVLFDAMNFEDIPETEGAGEYSDVREGSEKPLSHWIDVSPPFKGRQPKGLLGKRVNVVLSNGQYQYAVLNDVMFDPDILTPKKAGEIEMPNNSSMTRLPCYESGDLPPPTKENVGCVIVELAGPQGDDWLMVCLKRNGAYKWVRHIDRLHYHTGQLPDSHGDAEKRTFDATIETTGSPKEGSD